MRTLFFAAAIVAMTGTSAMAQEIDFDQPSDTIGWTVDRYAPNGFTSGVVDGSRTVLVQSIAASDGANNRPAAFSSPFYNTQGMKSPTFDPGTTSFSIELYVGDDWDDAGKRQAGAWGIARDATNAISYYPIIEYSSDLLYGFGDGFRGWDPTASATGGWVNLGDTYTNYGGWNLLNIALNGANWEYSVNGRLLASVGANGSTNIELAILQGYNTALGVDYDITWDNLSAPGAVPEPSTWAMMIIGFGGMGALLRRRQTLTAAT